MWWLSRQRGKHVHNIKQPTEAWPLQELQLFWSCSSIEYEAAKGLEELGKTRV